MKVADGGNRLSARVRLNESNPSLNEAAAQSPRCRLRLRWVSILQNAQPRRGCGKDLGNRALNYGDKGKLNASENKRPGP